MSRPGESPKDKIYADCDALGYEETKRQLESSENVTFRQNSSYVYSWLKQEEEKIKQEQRIMQALDIAKTDSQTSQKSNRIAWIAACASLFSAAMAFIAVLLNMKL